MEAGTDKAIAMRDRHFNCSAWAAGVFEVTAGGPLLSADSSGEVPVKGLIAALVAGAILYVVDSQYNDGRYTQVLHQAVTSLLRG
ncbi:hypothetical protein [Bradyrhizobium sp. Tv2a-2]|uniref:hypothetical protein n=1 Tax=Bradyrhizobium sp. Tv2a-2 TaxID=113395 RepID=UPI0004074907|nr:hypothetical protein [Bradyrhizobium sp. Tv2a-2]